eukprot:72859-Chlamydomonas_euryale.AAC.11
MRRFVTIAAGMQRRRPGVRLLQIVARCGATGRQGGAGEFLLAAAGSDVSTQQKLGTDIGPGRGH